MADGYSATVHRGLPSAVAGDLVIITYIRDYIRSKSGTRSRDRERDDVSLLRHCLVLRILPTTTGAIATVLIAAFTYLLERSTKLRIIFGEIRLELLGRIDLRTTRPPEPITRQLILKYLHFHLATCLLALATSREYNGPPWGETSR